MILTNIKIKINAVPKSGCKAVIRKGNKVIPKLVINIVKSFHFLFLCSIIADNSIISASLASSEG